MLTRVRSVVGKASGAADGGTRGLSCNEITVTFGGVTAVDNVSLNLAPDEIIGVIGPNGAGKSTLVNVLSGYQEPAHGAVTLNDVDVTTWPAHKRARAGLVRTFQAVRLFSGLSVIENIAAGALGNGLPGRVATDRADRVAEQLGLANWREADGASLPHGIERRVGIARALATEPTFLLLDEPAAGLNESESDELGSMLRTIRDKFGCGICVIEHDMRLIMSLCERIHVLDSGRTLAEGPAAEIRDNPAVRAAYLGG